MTGSRAGPTSAALGAVACLVGAAALSWEVGPGTPQPPAPATAWRTQAPPTRPAPSPTRSSAQALPRSRPTMLTIAAIGVRTPLMELGLLPDGRPAVPPLGRHSPAGWLTALASPGQIGPAVIIGHVDTARDGPAVFFHLRDLRPGDRILVERADGHRVEFAVTSVVTVPKADFPSSAVYGPVDHPALRLITCGGTFDRAAGHYRSSVIVFASAWRPDADATQGGSRTLRT